MLGLSYTVIVLIATTIGAMTGLGGGVIIKPLFDLIGGSTASAISFYSSVSVFTMCVVSIYKQTRRGFSFDLRVLLSLSSGSIIGGFIGESFFSLTTTQFDNRQVKLIQSILLLITLLFILFYTFNKSKFKHYQLKNIFSYGLVGIFLGTISVFLGIGGGPLNVACMLILFSYSMKQAAIYSIATIFFSQIAKLSMVVAKGQLLTFDLEIIPFLIGAAIIGGYLGSCINHRLSDQKVEIAYRTLIIFLVFVTIINIFNK